MPTLTFQTTVPRRNYTSLMNELHDYTSNKFYSQRMLPNRLIRAGTDPPPPRQMLLLQELRRWRPQGMHCVGFVGGCAFDEGSLIVTEASLHYSVCCCFVRGVLLFSWRTFSKYVLSFGSLFKECTIAGMPVGIENDDTLLST